LRGNATIDYRIFYSLLVAFGGWKEYMDIRDSSKEVRTKDENLISKKKRKKKKELRES
jgi:hypothetical protein